MEHGPQNLIYFDTRAREERVVAESDLHKLGLVDGPSPKTQTPVHEDEIEQNIQALLSAFPQLYLCRSATSCLQRLDSLQAANCNASTVVVISTSPEKEQLNSAERQARSPSPRSMPGAAHHVEDLDGLSFLRHVVSEKRVRHSLANVTPVVMLENTSPVPIPMGKPTDALSTPDRGRKLPNSELNRRAFASNSQYLGLGAVDVLQSPLSAERAQCLPAHAYKTSQDVLRAEGGGSAPGSRKASWVGINENKPFSYLRESMVSGLMDRICDPDYPEKPLDPNELQVPQARKLAVEKSIGVWSFSAHEYSDDELLYGAMVILQHTLKMPGLKTWQISDDEMIIFLLSCRRVYNSFVIYHNFRHACDVLQATFCFLIEIGAIPPFPQSQSETSQTDGIPLLNTQINGHSHDTSNPPIKKSPLASILRPFEAMTLIIAAIGHDVGHPGVNNLFLITLNAPLAQLYNDRSVLESFHCAAFSQILRRYWPAAFQEPSLRKLLINSILATDMSVHGDYIKSLDKLNEELDKDQDFASKLEEGLLNDHRTLLCCLIIKCADISNVARHFPVAASWADVLTDEFANQASMESELDMPSCLFGGPPVLNDIVKMGQSQTGFMKYFGFPLFEKISHALPGLKFAVEQVEVNRAKWEATIAEAGRKVAKDNSSVTSSERTQSPFQARRGSQIVQSQMRSDPMVFGAHSPLTQLRKQSGGNHSQVSSLNFNSTRRASLGPTVIPINYSPNAGSRRSSGSHGRFANRIPDVHAAAGGAGSATLAGLGTSMPSMPTATTGGLLTPQLDGVDDSAARSASALPILESTGGGMGVAASSPGQHHVQQLLDHPPPFVSQDPNGNGAASAPASGGDAGPDAGGPGVGMDTEQASRGDGAGESSGSGTGPRSPLRGRAGLSNEDHDHADTERGGRERAASGSRSRGKRGRKFSLRFWRKTRSDDGDCGTNGIVTQANERGVGGEHGVSRGGRGSGSAD